MAELNKMYRGIDGTTDVLSFPMLEGEEDPEADELFSEFLLGDIVVSVPRAREQAREGGHSLEKEMAFLAVHSMGYSRELPSFLELATCVISKAGGMTVSEALVKELPLIIYRPLPCQEEKNRDYLVSSGAALTAEDLVELEECLREVLLRPHLCSRMRAAARRLRRPDAAREAARLLLAYRK